MVGSESSHHDPVLVSPAGSSHQDSVPGSPFRDTVFNDALKKSLKIYAGLGIVVGVSVGLKIWVQKPIENTRSHHERAYVSPLFHPSSVDINRLTNVLTCDLPRAQ